MLPREVDNASDVVQCELDRTVLALGPVARPAQISMPSFSALVLAAGQSTRMGRDKALLEVNGIPMWQRQRDVLANAGAAEIFLSARPDQAWTRTAKGFTAVLHDAMPGCGPLVGLTAGLERSTDPLLAVVAIDLPEITSEWFRTLLGEAKVGCGIVPRRGEIYEPLAAIYPREIMWLAWEGLVRAEYSLQKFVAAGVAKGLLREHVLTTEELPLLANWNREAERS
jgi:molybdenum cofactor guanylyltransferase